MPRDLFFPFFQKEPPIKVSYCKRDKKGLKLSDTCIL